MTLEVDIATRSGTTRQRVEIQRMYNLGSATRNADAAVPHQEEVAKAGIRIALDVPAPRIYPIAPHALTTGNEVLVHGAKTSGEIEFVLLKSDRLYIGVGSDHTDRDLERTSITWSKQVCQNVLAPTMWDFEEVSKHWDDCMMTSHVDGKLYQKVAASVFMRPERLLEIVAERVAVLPPRDYLVYSGTIVALDKELGYGREWSIALEDPVLQRSLTHRYRVTPLFEEIKAEFRVPLTAS